MCDWLSDRLSNTAQIKKKLIKKEKLKKEKKEVDQQRK